MARERAKHIKRFSYAKWAKGVASQILESDLSCGFAVADETPDREKAIEAVVHLICQLRDASEKGGD